jgi:hypothetical protein
MLPTIEIDGSFYSLQRPESYAAWHAETPPGFVFAVKGAANGSCMRAATARRRSAAGRRASRPDVPAARSATRGWRRRDQRRRVPGATSIATSTTPSRCTRRTTLPVSPRAAASRPAWSAASASFRHPASPPRARSTSFGSAPARPR